MEANHAFISFLNTHLCCGLLTAIISYTILSSSNAFHCGHSSSLSPVPALYCVDQQVLLLAVILT